MPVVESVIESLMMSKSDSSLFWLVAWWSATLSVVSCDGDVSREAMMYAGASAITGKVISTIAVFHIRCLVDCGAFMVLYSPPLYLAVCSYIIYEAGMNGVGFGSGLGGCWGIVGVRNLHG